MLVKPWKVIEDDTSKISIYGNNHIRDLLYYWDLTPEQQEWVRSEYDYLFDELDDYNECEGMFFVYKDWIYSLDNFMSIHNKIYMPNSPSWLLEFDGIHNDSFFSGILIKFVDDNWDCDNGIKVYTFIA